MRYFYPRPPGGGRRYCFAAAAGRRLDFYPRPPGGGRLAQDKIFERCKYISIHALRVEGDFWPCIYRVARTISIHALRVEGDLGVSGNYLWMIEISIHALRVEGDCFGRQVVGLGTNFYPRPPGGGRLCKNLTEEAEEAISIHALRVEGDQGIAYHCCHGDDFYPRPPGGGRRLAIVAHLLFPFWISIHALRVEGDSKNGQSFRLFLRKREKNLPL